MRRFLRSAGAAALLLSACTSTSSSEPAAQVDDTAVDLVLVYDADGGPNALASYRPDGTLVTSYAAADEGAIRQPIWSPDGERVAWARGRAPADQEPADREPAEWELVTSGVDGTGGTAHPLPARPDYITYDPTSSVVLALTPSPAGFGLVIVDVLDDAADQDEPYSVVDLGRPYFSDFSPDGSRVIAHVASEMRLVELDGEPVSLGTASIGHQTPSWHPTDEIVFFTEATNGVNQLVRHDLASGSTDGIAAFGGFVFFDLDPAGSSLAVAAFDTAGGRGPEAMRGSPQRRLGPGLWVIDADGGEPRRVDEQPAAAPMWDPTGSRFLVRTSIGGVGSWKVYSRDEMVSSTQRFDIDDTLLPAYLPFWDQYVRSQTLWSPDGTRFAHAGRSDEGTSGIWIHDASDSGDSTHLADGDLAFWSPT